MLGLKFAYATNGHEIIEFDYFTGLEARCSAYPKTDGEGVSALVRNSLCWSMESQTKTLKKAIWSGRGKQALSLSFAERYEIQ